MHALIIEDDRLNAEVIQRLLASINITTTLVNDPALLEMVIASGSQPDLVFLDLELPHMDGYEVLSMLRQTLPNTRVIACTVHTNESARALELGFDGFLAKPLDADYFPEQMQHIIAGERVWVSR